MLIRPDTGTPAGAGTGTCVQVLLNLGKGGMESMAVGLAAELGRHGRRSVVVALDAGGEHEEVLARAGVEYHVMGGRRFRDMRSHERLARLFRRVNAHVVHTHHFGTLAHALPAALLAGVPRRVHTEHSFEYLKTRPDYRIALHLMSRFTHAFAVVGETMRPFYVERVRIAGRLLKVIPNGIATEIYRPVADREAARRDAGLPAGVLVGSAGRLFPEKNLDLLLEAAAVAGRGLGTLHLLLIGDGPERSALEGRAAALGWGDRVHFLGWRADVAALLPLLDVFVLSSRHEGLPLAVLEAMACGVPVVASAVGDLPIVVEEGVTGLLFPPGDSAALARCISGLALDQTRGASMGLAGRRRVESRYSQEAMLQRYLELYDA